MQKLPIYNVVLNKCDGVVKMSLVDFPAVESDFLAFAKEGSAEMKFSLDEEQRIVFGCALRADFPIYRQGRDFAYYVVFNKETIKELYEKFMIDGMQNMVNLQHQVDVSGVYLIQSFIKNTEAGISPIGFEDINDGSWFVAYKVLNDKVWEDVKKGIFNGFSVELMAEMELMTDKNEEDELYDLIRKILND